MVLKPEKKRRFLSRIFNFRGIAFRTGLLFVAGISLVLIISFGYILVYAMMIMLKDTQMHATNVTNLTISRIEAIINPVEEVTQAMARAIESNEKGYNEVLRMSREYVKASPVVFGTCIAFEPNAFEKGRYYYAPYFFENDEGTHSRLLGSRDYDYFTKSWYINVKKTNKPGWSEPYFDAGGGNAYMCTYSVPFYRMLKDSTRKFSGVITMDISLKSLENIVSSVKVFESGFAMLVSADGKVLTSPDSTLINRDIKDLARKVKQNKDRPGIVFSTDEDINQVADSITEGKSGFAGTGYVMKNGKNGSMFYAPVGRTGWSLILVFASEELFSDLVDFLKKLGGVILASMGGALLITIIVMRRIARPIRKLASAARQVGQGDFHAPIPVFKSRNEIGQLARSFAAMQEELQTYIKNLQETTVAKEKIESELNVAHEIQEGMLPKIFPTQSECDVYAILKPAKAVGGDLYDFFFTDENHLCFVIGDVSGKSVPASLFMAVTRTLFRAKAYNGMPLNQVMESINTELCKDNPNMMFVTFQAAVLDLRTGITEICNAGHNYPFIHRKNNEITKFRCKPGLPLGVMEDAVYTTDSVKLGAGDCILMYTDGVTEAISITESFFMEDKLIHSMLSLPDGSAREIATNLLHDVKEFTEDAEQSDDITLLVVKYRGERNGHRKEEVRDITIENQVSELGKITTIIEELGEKWNFSPKTAMEVNLALEEWITNIIFHAFTDETKHSINIHFNKKENNLTIIINDDGNEFNPTEYPEPVNLESPAEDRAIGGLGIHFIKKVMDKIDYSRENGHNILKLQKTIK